MCLRPQFLGHGAQRFHLGVTGQFEIWPPNRVRAAGYDLAVEHDDSADRQVSLLFRGQGLINGLAEKSCLVVGERVWGRHG